MGKAKSKSMISTERIERSILLIRGHKVILDADLAEIYGVSTKRLNEQVKRNADRFPADFAFRLSLEEFEIVRSQFATLNSSGKTMRSQIATASKRNIRYLPYAFTEHGAIMGATVLNSPRAIQMSVFVVRAFVRMRQVLIAQRNLAEIEKKLTERLDVHETAIVEVLRQIMTLLTPPHEPESPRKKIGFPVDEGKGLYKAPGKKRGGRRSGRRSGRTD